MLMINKTLSNKIYYTSFILAIFVVVLHSSYVDFLNPSLTGYYFSYFIQRIFLVIGDAAVPTFFVISGYLLFTKFDIKKYPKLLLNKLLSLVVPYLVWSVLAFLLMRIFLPILSGGVIELDFKSTVINILMAEEFPHLWFVRPLLVFFTCSPLIYFTFKYLKKWSIVIPIILFFVYLLFRPEYGGILIWIPFFFVGSYLSYFKIPVTRQNHSRLTSIIVLVAFIFLALVFTLSHTEYEDNAYYFYRFISPLLVWVSLDLLTPLFEKEKIHEIFKTSGFIFFSHLGMVFAAKSVLEPLIKMESNYNCALLFFLVFLVSTTLELLFTYLLKRFAKPVYRFLGGR